MTTVTRKVQITSEDIAVGKPKNCSLCPGAIAIIRAFPEAKYVDVMDREIRLAFANLQTAGATCRWQSIESPEVLERFVNKFDLKHHVDPISFELTFNLENPTTCSSLPSSEPTLLVSTSDTGSDAISSTEE